MSLYKKNESLETFILSLKEFELTNAQTCLIRLNRDEALEILNTFLTTENPLTYVHKLESTYKELIELKNELKAKVNKHER